MSKTISIDEHLTKEEKYKVLCAQMEHLLEKNDLILTNLSNFLAAINQSFDTISWIGFYFMQNNALHLGPFQGKTACTFIELGKGVCGDSAKQRKTIIVPDVDQYPGHIACDSASRSEIVIPLIQNDVLYGVLDIDSSYFNNFDGTDRIYLEQLCNTLFQFVNFEKFNIT